MGAAVRTLVAIYAVMFLGLTLAVAREWLSTTHWTSVHGHTFVLMLFVMSGWFDKLATVFNSVIGLGSGVLAVKSDNTGKWYDRAYLIVIGSVLVLIAVVSLADIFLLAYWSPEVAANVPGVHDAGYSGVQAVVSALGAVSLSIVAGFVAGVGIGSVPLPSAARAGA
jgi:hypothetical protein